MNAARTWLKYNLFRSPRDAIVTVVAGAVSIYVLYRTFNFVFVTGRWDIVRVNLRLLMYGRFAEVHVLRLAVTVVGLAAWGGLVAGIVHARQARADHGQTPRPAPFSAARIIDLVERLWLPAVAILLLLVLSSTPGTWLTAGLAVAGIIVGRLIGAVVGRPKLNLWQSVLLWVAVGAIPLVLYLYLSDGVGFDEWGGFMLNMFLALCSIVLCYPLGVLLALGRRSSLPLVRVLCTIYIEAWRGSPLFVLLLFANIAAGFFLPQDLTPSTTTRAIIIFTLFTAAYMAEIVRGGLQSVPSGQFEAAKAMGLSPARQTALIILPQAIRNVIPAQIGQLISLFKDTTLAGAAMGVFELLNVSGAIPAQGEFRGQGLIGETLAFAAMLFWVGSYTMSRESQRLEKRLGVGTR